MSGPAPRLRVTREGYFAAAMTLLAQEGAAALTLGRLCAAVGVTSGSFYHHFAGVDGFVAALLEHWEAEQTRRVLAVVGSSPDPWERVRVMKHLAAALPHDAEAAIRGWAPQHPAVALAQRRMDTERAAGLREVIAGVGVDAGTAQRLSLLGVSILAGVQQVGPSPVDPDRVLALLGDLEDVIRAHAGGAGPG